ncbi:hypothetical protein GJ744_001682 [Endocarpon pusillum]|uniref:Uncharacterized protein n=1 Tax=Endocarpon pusillum TaxID=364733 RepID=A0A8H7ACW7_9EURO|nr:hypothetical protein GJ744_001682 [Endocarpon pusillum]
MGVKIAPRQAQACCFHGASADAWETASKNEDGPLETFTSSPSAQLEELSNNETFPLQLSQVPTMLRPWDLTQCTHIGPDRAQPSLHFM